MIFELRRGLRLTVQANSRSLFRALLKGKAFIHLATLVNRSKHRALVLTSLSEDWTCKEPQRHRLRLDYFVHNGKSYPAVDVTGFLSDEYDRCYKLGVDMGKELHRLLEARVASRSA